MKTFFIIIFFILGCVFGSFYNVVAFRVSKKESIIKPKSHCPKCNHILRFYELIPVISYLIQKGKCRNCHEKISLFYPLMEIFSGILFSISFYSFGFSYDLLMALALSSMFIIIIVTDLNYYIIPDEINIAFSIIIFIINILIHSSILEALKYSAFGLIMFLFMYALMIIGNFLFKQESLGGGDVKLLFVLGMTSPIILSFFGITLAAFLALPISIYLYLRHKDKVLPFGPFLVAGFLIIYLLKIDVSDIYNFLKF